MIGAGRFRRLGVGQDVVAVDGFVAAVKNVAAPGADENPFRGAALVACADIDRTAPLGRPAHNLDGIVRIIDQAAIPLKRRRRGIDNRHDNAGKARRQIGIQVVDRRHRIHGLGLFPQRVAPALCLDRRRFTTVEAVDWGMNQAGYQ